MSPINNKYWSDHTWNPWRGCTKISPGCENCYVFRHMPRYGQNPARVTRSLDVIFNAPLQWAKIWPGDCIVVCSWSDFFHPAADAWRADAWDIIRQTPQMNYLILTKRPELIAAALPADWGDGWPHVWLGISIEDQAAAKKRIQRLIEIPTQRRILSIEPLLGEVNIVNAIPTPTDDYIWDEVNLWDDEDIPEEIVEYCEIDDDGIGGDDLVPNPEYLEWRLRRDVKARELLLQQNIDWVLVCGETGENARSCAPDWVRKLRDACLDLDIPFFFKGWGSQLAIEPGAVQPNKIPHEDNQTAYPTILDGQEWTQIPGALSGGI